MNLLKNPQIMTTEHSMEEEHYFCSMVNNGQKIVFYDGDCGFCNRSVQFILLYEKDDTIHFAAIQSNFTAHFFNERGYPSPTLDSLYFFDGKELLVRSDAALAISRHLKFPWGLLNFFKWTPVKLRDAVYSFVARNRRKLGAQSCFVPTLEQRKRFPEFIQAQQQKP